MSVVPGRPRLVLASGSPRRLALLQQAGVEPDRLMPAEIDETPRPRESPRKLALRLAKEKARVASERLAGDPVDEKAIVLSADTVVCVDGAFCRRRRRRTKPRRACAFSPAARIGSIPGS